MDWIPGEVCYGEFPWLSRILRRPMSIIIILRQHRMKVRVVAGFRSLTRIARVIQMGFAEHM